MGKVIIVAKNRSVGLDVGPCDVDEMNCLLYDTNLKEEVETGSNGK